MRDSGTYERVAAVLTSKVPGTYFTNSDIDEILDACQEAAKQVRGSGQERKCCFEWKETGLTCEDCPGVPELDQKMGYK